MARPNPKSAFVWNERLAGTQRKIIRSVEEAGGSYDDLLKFLASPQAAQLGLLVMGTLPLAQSPCQRLVPHLIPEWVTGVVEDVEPTLAPGAKLSFPSFLRKSDGGCIGCKTMRIRAKEMKANYGLSDVPAILGSDGKGLTTIPVELRGEAYIVLTATVLRVSGGGLYVPVLVWRYDAWVVRFHSLDHVWIACSRLVSCE